MIAGNVDGPGAADRDRKADGGARFSIRGVTPRNPFVLAPLDGYTDLPFRTLCRECGAGICITEMVPAIALVRGVRDAKQRMRSDPEDRPRWVQIVTSTPELAAGAARIAEANGADLVDLNAGCPSRRVTNNGSGSALLSELPLLARLLTAMRAAIRVPLTLKIRSGPAAGRLVLDEVAKIAADCGVDAITLHPRTRAQGFAGGADWSLIARFRNMWSGPLVGNGDVTSAEGALRMMAETGCDAVMIGRAAIGNPWIFGEADAAWRGLPPPPRPDNAALFKTLLRHFDLMTEHVGGEETAARVFRKHLHRYVRGIPGAIDVRRNLPDVISRASLLKALALVGYALRARENG